jgi:hypothetical protein
MTDRSNIKSIWRSCPIWTLRILSIVLIPVYLGMGIWYGIKEGVNSWYLEWKELGSL